MSLSLTTPSVILARRARFPTGSDRSERQRNECREETKGTGDRRERGTRLITLSPILPLSPGSPRPEGSPGGGGNRRREGRDGGWEREDSPRQRKCYGVSLGVPLVPSPLFLITRGAVAREPSGERGAGGTRQGAIRTEVSE